MGLDGGKIPAGACAYGICRRLWSLPSAGGTGEVLREVEIRRVDPSLIAESRSGAGLLLRKGLSYVPQLAAGVDLCSAGRRSDLDERKSSGDLGEGPVASRDVTGMRSTW